MTDTEFVDEPDCHKQHSADEHEKQAVIVQLGLAGERSGIPQPNDGELNG